MIEKLILELSEISYQAGLLHGYGLLGSKEHREALEKSKEIFNRIKELLEKTDDSKNIKSP